MGDVMRKTLAMMGLVLAAWSIPHTAGAGTILFYSGVCTTRCGEIGLTTGDPISGYFDIASAAVVPGGPVTDSDFLAFDFSFGNFDLASPSDTILILGGTALFDGTATAIVGTGTLQFRLGGSTYVAGISLSDGSWFAAPPTDYTDARGTGVFSAVPEPALPLLFALGLFSKVLHRTRRDDS